MKSVTRDKVYEGPVRKLSRFFEKSRDQREAKCRATKTLVKRLKSRVRLLEESRGRYSVRQFQRILTFDKSQHSTKSDETKTAGRESM